MNIEQDKGNSFEKALSGLFKDQPGGQGGWNQVSEVESVRRWRQRGEGRGANLVEPG